MKKICTQNIKLHQNSKYANSTILSKHLCDIKNEYQMTTAELNLQKLGVNTPIQNSKNIKKTKKQIKQSWVV